ncbi:M23 family metallopeptidase [Rathayibacter sp. ZW T2_19]|uniref:M23 family metallopeptidase n=1 Tax=Rathayibacter rubneri TaxID=2950106 RepID=A0A9X2DXG8_9MICO|nr:M23 family metallopeptidase [Rathayibacter rubneri]MCM6761388.1 M23 family metallopeptidase [Rathayibacter rubneri]
MTLSNYRLATPSTVILADNRDPMQSYQRHLLTTGRGGVDIVAPVGTPVYARTPGVMRRIPNNGSAGNSCRFEHDDNPGWADVFSHLTGYVGEDGQHFDVGQVVAYTGKTGTKDPHLHWHLLDPNGNRRNPWLYFTPLAATRPTQEEDDDMPLTTDERRLLEDANTNAAEARRLAGLALGVPLNASPDEYEAYLRDRGSFETLAELRRMLAAILKQTDAPAGAPGEDNLRKKLDAILAK